MQTWRMKLLFNKYPLLKYFDSATEKTFLWEFLFCMAESTLKQKFWKKPESFSDTSHINWYLKMLVWLMYENKIFHNVIFFNHEEGGNSV